MPVEKVHILLECLLLYTNPIVYPKCVGSEIKSIVKLNKLSSVVTVCRHGFHNDVMAPMFQFGGGAIHRIYVAWVVLVKVMFPRLNLRPDNEVLHYSMFEVFNNIGNSLADIAIA